MRSISRSDFFRLTGMLVLIAACGGDDGDDAPAPDGPGPTPDGPPPPIDAPAASCTQNGTTVGISGNHGHVLMVPAADVQAAQERTYDISGAAGHAHSVTITAAQFGMLAQNTTITVTSTAGAAHSHTITVACA